MMQINIQRLTLSLVWITCVAIILACLTVVGAMLGLLPIAASQHNQNAVSLKSNLNQFQESECSELYEDSAVDGVNGQTPWVRTFDIQSSKRFVIEI